MAKVFGIVAADVTDMTSYGVLQEVDSSDSVEVAEARDEDGYITDMIAYSKTEEKTYNYVVNGTKPTVGSVWVSGTLNFLITAVSQKHSNTEFSSGTLTAQRKDNATITAYSAPA